MNRIEMITRAPMSIQVLKDGNDITAKLGVKQIKYNADGTASRTMAEGSVNPLGWRFVDPAQTWLEMTSPRGTTHWEVLEVTATLFRKRDLAIGAEIVQRSP